MSSAEAEFNTLTIVIMSAMHVKMIHQEFTHGDSSWPLTIPFNGWHSCYAYLLPYIYSC